MIVDKKLLSIAFPNIDRYIFKNSNKFHIYIDIYLKIPIYIYIYIYGSGMRTRI